MAEIPKLLKKVMIINAVVFFIFCIFYIGVFNVLLDIVSWPSFDRLYSYTFGGILLVLGIFSLLISYRDNEIQTKLLFEIIIACEIEMVFTSFYVTYFTFTPPTTLPIPIIWVTNFVFIGLIVLNIIVYRKDR